MPDTRCLAELTPDQRDYLLALIEEERVTLHPLDHRRPLLAATRDALEGALEVTDPWHMMGTRPDGAAVGKGMGPIGGCGQSRDCAPPTPEQVRDGPFAREGVPMGRIAGYTAVGMARTGVPMIDAMNDFNASHAEVPLGEIDGKKYTAVVPRTEANEREYRERLDRLSAEKMYGMSNGSLIPQDMKDDHARIARLAFAPPQPHTPPHRPWANPEGADDARHDPPEPSTPLTAPCNPCGHMLAYHGSFGGSCDHLDCSCSRFGKSW
jgi:hypothetical protein